MRPERFDWAISLFLKGLRALAAILLALFFFQTGITRAADSTPKSSEGLIYDSPSFLKELGRLKIGLETAAKSTETLRAYRESLPETWAVDAGGRHYFVPTDLLTSRLEKAERQPEIRGLQVE